MTGGKEPDVVCPVDCGPVVAERNRYFDGKFMTARDFRADPDYLLSHQRLHHRMLHGWGIVCGLNVIRHPNPRCPRWIVVTSGIAIDCCGRELILERDTPLQLPPREDDASGSGPADAGGPVDEPLLVIVRYVEHAVEKIPVLFHEGGCDPTRNEANRIREAADLGFRPLHAVAPDCWRRPGGDMPADCDDDCPDEPGSGVSCLHPHCPCGDAVPLALISGAEASGQGFEIDTGGRRELPSAAQHLTHVTGINWTHGGSLTLDDLQDRGRRLLVQFDRRIAPAQGDATGINEYTFQVEWGNPLEGERDVLRYDPDYPPNVEDGCRAVFTIHPDYLGGARRRNTIAGSTVFVTLHCDFVLDCHGHAVDGNHLGGRLPSGDGVAGGDFTSWFRVIYGDESREDEA